MNGSTRPRYRATHVTDSSSYDATRGAHRTKQVHFVLADGTKSYVEVPLDTYDAATVQRHLEAAATAHERIMSLQPGQPVENDDYSSDPWDK